MAAATGASEERINSRPGITARREKGTGWSVGKPRFGSSIADSLHLLTHVKTARAYDFALPSRCAAAPQAPETIAGAETAGIAGADPMLVILRAVQDPYATRSDAVGQAMGCVAVASNKDEWMNISPGEHIFSNNGLKLRYKVAGSGPVLMVQPPGWGVGAGLYEHAFGPLESHFTLIYHDPRGSGRSEAPADSAEMNVGAFVEDLESLREHLKLESFALLGHSHGGFIALNYALKYPRRLSHLLPVDAQLGVDEPREDAERNLPELGKDTRFTEAVQAFGGPWKLESDEDMSTLVHRVWPLYFFDPESEAAAASRKFVRASRISVAAMKATSASNGRFLVRDKLSAISVPTLVLVGRHDFLCSPVQAKTIHEGVGASGLVVFGRSGHLPWLEEPRMFFSTVTGFLSDRS